MKINRKNIKIAIIGIGYVGLPLSIEFGKKFEVFGFDHNLKRINQLKKRYDKNLDINKSQFTKSKFLRFTNNINNISKCNVFIITVPTPINKKREPNLKLIKLACKLVGKILKLKDTVIFESTFYPGLTEEVCVPILQETSSLLYNKDFFCGYSPERINPNDKIHRLTNIVKITSGSNKNTANFVDNLYKKIVTAGTYKASSIKIAEAAKVIENAQRDLNIAFVNELSIMFNKMGLNSKEILDAASTKWNFLNFKPGLVGGHCINVDPYYLTHKAETIGYKPKIILAGRKLNDNMGLYVSKILRKTMIKKNIKIKGSKVLIMGLTFKEDCADCRNTKVIDVIKSLKKYGIFVDVYDPWINNSLINKSHNVNLIKNIKKNNYDALVVAVAHTIFKKMRIKNVLSFLKNNYIIYDLKNILPSHPNKLVL